MKISKQKEENMKEYKTLRVSPEDEAECIQEMETFGWKLEDSREIYNESEELVGVHGKETVYGGGLLGGFMQGFTGSSGKQQVTVQTRTNVVHFLSMRFSRDQSFKNYPEIARLEQVFYETPEGLMRYVYEPEPPKRRTIVSVILIVVFAIALVATIAESMPESMILAASLLLAAAILFLILSWVFYVVIKRKQGEKNRAIRAHNETIGDAKERRCEEILRRHEVLIKEDNVQ